MRVPPLSTLCARPTPSLRFLGPNPRSSGGYPPELDCGGPQLAFVQVDRAVTGPNYDGRTAAIHLAVDPRRAKCSFHCHWNVQADVPVVRPGIDVGPDLAGQFQIHTAIARVNIPSTFHF